MRVADLMLLGLPTEDAIELSGFIRQYPNLIGIGIASHRDGEPATWWNGFYMEHPSETGVLYPRLYKSIAAAKRTAKMLREREQDRTICPQVWLAPEHELAQVIPLDKYLRMTGIRYTGSTTQ